MEFSIMVFFEFLYVLGVFEVKILSGFCWVGYRVSYYFFISFSLFWRGVGKVVVFVFVF